MKKILVVEETAGATRAFVESLVRERRYEVRTAVAGPLALCRAHEFQPDLLIADVATARGESLSVAATLGWVHALPSLLLCDEPRPADHVPPAECRILPRGCDGATLLGAVGTLLSE